VHPLPSPDLPPLPEVPTLPEVPPIMLADGGEMNGEMPVDGCATTGDVTCAVIDGVVDGLLS
jgi:hypothetical protein